MRILGIDSSSYPASVAVVENERIVAEFFIHTKLTHSQTLMPMVKAVLDMTKLAVNDMDLIAVSKGPGSFTGVRIGVASAKGIAFPGSINCCGVSSLEALAYNFFSDMDDKIICACMDARCGQVYNAFFMLKDGKISRLTKDATIAVADLAEMTENYDSSLYLVGDGAEIVYKELSEFGAVLAPENLRYQKASSVAFAAINSKENKAVSVGALQPVYLQLPQATRELNAKSNKNI